MPFDPFVRSAADLLAGLGITPITEQELDSHREAQIAAHPGSLLFRIRETLFTSILNAMIVGLGCFGAGSIVIVILASVEHSQVSDDWAFSVSLGLFWVGLLTIIIGLGAMLILPNVKVRRPAYWTESYGVGDEPVPEPILALVHQVKAAYPRATVILGKLQQETVVLDPYLVVRLHGTEACLGIWDDHGVIRIAQTDASATLAD